MPSAPNIVHAIFAFGSFSAVIVSLLISIKLGAYQFIKHNLLNGLCVDVWDGFFLSSANLIAIGFLLYLPIHCYSIQAPPTVLCLTTVMGIPSILFLCASLLEISPVALPIGVVIGSFGTFGLSELRLARRKDFEEEPSIKTVWKSTSSSSISRSYRHPARPVRPNPNLRASSKPIPLPALMPSPNIKSSLSRPTSLSKRKRRES